jgi:hypothetical protein
VLGVVWWWCEEVWWCGSGVVVLWGGGVFVVSGGCFCGWPGGCLALEGMQAPAHKVEACTADVCIFRQVAERRSP